MQQGFSIVELVVTLFIAAAFLATGHMLYTTITRDSSEARQRGHASNVAYDYVRQYADNRSGTCSGTSTPVNNERQSIDGFGDVIIRVRITCPNSAINTLHRVEATVRYGDLSQEVVHVLYATS